MPNASFGAADFDVLWANPFTVPIPLAEDTFAYRDVPYGSRTIAQNLGRHAVEGQYSVEMTIAEYTTLLSLRGTVGTLTVAGDGTHPGTLFLRPTNVERDDTNDRVTATLLFRVP